LSHFSERVGEVAQSLVLFYSRLYLSRPMLFLGNFIHRNPNRWDRG